MKIYIASGFNNREHINRDIVPLLRERGIEVVSRWLRDDHGFVVPPEHNVEYAYMDFVDIREADLVIGYNPKSSTGGGTYFELGFSYAIDKIVVLVGSKSGTPFEELFPHWENIENLIPLLDVDLTRLEGHRQLSQNLYG